MIALIRDDGFFPFRRSKKERLKTDQSEDPEGTHGSIGSNEGGQSKVCESSGDADGENIAGASLFRRHGWILFFKGFRGFRRCKEFLTLLRDRMGAGLVHKSTDMRVESVAVYCGSRAGALRAYAEAARLVGRTLGEEGVRVVYGGGDIGLMGVVADAALEAGGEVIGVIPKDLMALELGHTGVTELHQVESMHERKTMMADLSDAFVALPGGIGTMEEIFEVFTWTQLGFQAKPCAFLNVAGYYDELFAFLKTMVRQGFLKDRNHEDLVIGEDFEEILQIFRSYEPMDAPIWVERRSDGR